MPMYEYRCKLCGHETEVMQKITEDALTQCTACGKDGFVKLISRSAFHLKGDGWYKPAAVDKPAETKPDTKTETKTETPAAPAKEAD